MDFVQSTARFFTEQWLTVFIGAAVAVFLYWKATSRRRALEAAYPDLPMVKPLPFLGNLLDSIRAKGQFHLQFAEYHRKYGKLFSFYSFTGKPALVVSDSEMVKQIMVKEFSSFHDRPVSAALLYELLPDSDS